MKKKSNIRKRGRPIKNSSEDIYKIIDASNIKKKRGSIEEVDKLVRTMESMEVGQGCLIPGTTIADSRKVLSRVTYIRKSYPHLSKNKYFTCISNYEKGQLNGVIVKREK